MAGSRTLSGYRTKNRTSRRKVAPRVGSDARDLISSGALKTAQSIPDANVPTPTPPGASGCLVPWVRYVPFDQLAPSLDELHG
jgi:hypothetical protein